MLLALVLSAVLGHQAPGAQLAAAPDCSTPAGEAIALLCAGERFLKQGDQEDAADDERDAAWTQAATSFRRSADATRDATTKKRALEQLQRVYDGQHLSSPRDREPVLRELIAGYPADGSAMYRLGRLQEDEELIDAAEATLQFARQQHADDVQSYRELAQFYSRRVAAMSDDGERKNRATQIRREPGTADEHGVYSLGEGVQPPERQTAEGFPVPPEVKAAGITGSVGLEIIVDASGRVADARIVRSVPLLDVAALAAVRQWRFAPASRNGTAVPVRMIVVIKFGA